MCIFIPAVPYASLALSESSPTAVYVGNSQQCLLLFFIFHFNLSHSAHNILGGRIERRKNLPAIVAARARAPGSSMYTKIFFIVWKIFVEINKRANGRGRGRGHHSNAVEKKVAACAVAAYGLPNGSVCPIINNLSWIWWRGGAAPVPVFIGAECLLLRCKLL